MYERSLLVVKIGGSLIPEYGSLEIENLEMLAEDLGKVYKENDVVIVHGGANRVSYRMRKLGKEPEFIVSPEGFRSRRTDEETMRIFAEVMKEINDELLTLLRRYELKPVGLCNESSPIRASRKRPIAVIDGRRRIINDDYTGKIEGVDINSLKAYIQEGRIPVIGPIGIGNENELLNIDGDTAAACVSSSLRAQRLIDLTDVCGVLSEGRVVSTINYHDLDYWIERVEGGMKRKLLSAKKTIEMGVEEFIIGSGLKENPLTRALYHENCTVIQ